MSLSVLWCIFKGALNAFASHAVDRWGTWSLSTFSCKRKAHVPICLPYQEFVCPAFLQASTRQPLARMQEIVGRTNVMAIRFSLFAFTSPNNASFVHRMPQTFSQPTKVLLWKSSWPCGDLERVQFSDCPESKPSACPRVIGQNGAFALTTARFWPITQGQVNSSLSKPLEDRATVCGKARGLDPAASEKGERKIQDLHASTLRITSRGLVPITSLIHSKLCSITLTLRGGGSMRTENVPYIQKGNQVLNH